MEGKAAAVIQLAGSGEWIVTNLRDSSAGVVLAADVVGRVLLRDDRGHLVAELRKGPAEVPLSVPAGRYDVRVLVPGKAFSTTITVKAGPRELTFPAVRYLHGYAVPNFYFHMSTAYNILRSNGVEVGKVDFLGG